MHILGIETSCDETAAAVLEIARPRAARLMRTPFSFSLRSNVTVSQIKTHARYGGVIPEVAARKQTEAAIPVVEQALRDARIAQPDAVAATYGPGLITSLRVGMVTARALAWAWKVPLIPVNHIAGHVVSALFPNHTSGAIEPYQFPALALIVSGGHTELILMKQPGSYSLVGRTRDDAAGEAFDKAAQLLGLGYPGGPAISAHAARGEARYAFPRPMLSSASFDFSFSGLKTALLYFLRDNNISRPRGRLLSDICASFQQAIVDVLAAKTIRAAKETRAQTVIVGGGVSANPLLRAEIQRRCERHRIACRIPPLAYTTDNAAMIALAGALQRPPRSIPVSQPRLSLTSLP